MARVVCGPDSWTHSLHEVCSTLAPGNAEYLSSSQCLATQGAARQVDMGIFWCEPEFHTAALCVFLHTAV